VDTQPLVDFAPTLRLAAMALLFALLPLAWVWLRARAASGGRPGGARLAALTALTLFLTFDLIVFGAFTRLSDSGLGCPDWPGCYGEASPLGAREDIHAAQTAAPGGPVTFTKAWIEMIHRYLAMTVGVLILAVAAFAWKERARLPFSPWWPTLTLVWVIVQGLFGKYTVTLKLYPAVVTLHLLGGLVLLVLLALQHEAFKQRPLALARPLRRAAWLAAALLALQVALGGWVSTNYAVLACTGFPTCNGQWWPAMDAANGFTLLRPLGEAGSSGYRTHEGLVAIHMAHRVFALVVVAVLGVLGWRLARMSGAGGATLRRFGLVLLSLTAAQVVSGLSNVVLGWPIAAALAHSAGAAGLALTLALLLARSAAQALPRPQARTRAPARANKAAA
jgi:cytochrome c oxidase assembly protein subunit 15